MPRLTELPESEVVIVTAELLQRACPTHGGWSAHQLRLLGLAWPPARGWRFIVRGRRIPRAAAELLVALGRDTGAKQGDLF